MSGFNSNTNNTAANKAQISRLTLYTKKLVRASRTIGVTKVAGYNQVRFLLGSSSPFGGKVSGLVEGMSYSSCLDVAKAMNAESAQALCDFVINQAGRANRDADRLAQLRRKAERILLSVGGGVAKSTAETVLAWEGDIDALRVKLAGEVEIPSTITDVEEAIDFVLSELS
jgi:hypothetical protein